MSYSTKPQDTPRKQLHELVEFVQSLQHGDGYHLHATTGRSATRHEIVRTAWANLAIEEPDLTLAEAQRILGEGGPEAP